MGLCVMPRPDAAEIGTVVKLEEKGAARGDKGLWTRTGCLAPVQKTLHNQDNQKPRPGTQHPTHPCCSQVSPCCRWRARRQTKMERMLTRRSGAPHGASDRESAWQ